MSMSWVSLREGQRQGVFGVLVVACASACSQRSAAPGATPNSALVSVQAGEGAAPEAVEPGAGSERSCKDLGLLPCDVQPGPEAELCPRVAECLIGIDGGEYNEPPKGDISCGALHDVAPAPPGSGLRQTAVVSIEGKMDAEPESSWRMEAAFLVAQTDQGFCLVDQLVVWDAIKDYQIEDELRLTWSAQAQPGPELQLEFQRVLQTDTEEGPFVDYESCREKRYSLAGGRFKALRQTEHEGRCTPEIGPN
jgi:hypothetical protein